MAYDLFWLQLVHKLPPTILERLRCFSKFEGARYEILIASVFARAGFEINWLDDLLTKGKHCEFIATHKVTGAKIGVEAKFRRRSAALNFPGGTVTPQTHIKGDVFHLYHQAVKQVPSEGIPFLIFIDVNVPVSFTGSFRLYRDTASFPWLKEIEDELAKIRSLDSQTAETSLYVTNLPYYYGNDDAPAPTGMLAIFPSLNPKVAFIDDDAVEDLLSCFRSYGEIPRQV